MSNLGDRTKYIGGSDVGAILGMNNYCTRKELWEEKTGRKKPFEGNAVTDLGTYLEDYVAKLYEEKCRCRVVQRHIEIKDDACPYMQAHIDREVQNHPQHDTVGVLEIKALGRYTYKKSIQNGLPAMYLLQLQYYLMLTGREWGVFAILNRDTGEMFDFEVKPSEKIQQKIYDAVKEFWECVKEDVEPPVLKENSKPDVIQPSDNEYTESDNIELLRAIQDYNEAKQEKDIAANKMKEAKITISKLVKENEKVQAGDTKVYWTQRNYAKVDKKGLREDYPKIYDKYVSQSKSKPYINIR